MCLIGWDDASAPRTGMDDPSAHELARCYKGADRARQECPSSYKRLNLTLAGRKWHRAHALNGHANGRMIQGTMGNEGPTALSHDGGAMTMAVTRICNSTIAAARALAIPALVLVTGLGLAGSAGADEGEKLDLKFNVMALGMRVATFKLGIDLSAASYRAGGELKTKGLANLFLGSSFEARSQGAHSSGILTPSQFSLETDGNKGERNAAVTWDTQGMATASLDYAVADFRVQDVAANMRAGVLDPLTALLTASLAPRDALCTGSYHVFDGKELYTLEYSFVKRDDFDDGDPGIYRGEAYQCEIVHRPVAGMSNKDRAEIAASGDGGISTYKVWMAPVHSTVLGRAAFLTVGASGTEDGHQFYLYLDKAELQGRPILGQ
jgi:hypothetical protein